MAPSFIQMDTLGHHGPEPSPEILHGPRLSEKRYGILALYKNDYVVGIGLLLLVVLLWTLSSFLTQVCPALFISYTNLHSYQHRTCMKTAITNHFCTIQINYNSIYSDNFHHMIIASPISIPARLPFIYYRFSSDTGGTEIVLLNCM